MRPGRTALDEQERIIRDILMLLPDIAKALTRRPPECVRGEEVSIAQVKALVYLAQYGPQTMSELAAGLDITLPSTTGLVQPLVEMAFCERHRDPEDKRVVHVCLSEQAQVLADRIMAERRGQVEAALEGMPPEGRRHFYEGLKRLAAVFRGEAPDCRVTSSAAPADPKED